MAKKVKKNKGFTLVEVVIAIAITAMVMGTAYGAISQILTTKRFLDDRRDVSLTAYAIIQRITREFQLTVGDIPLVFENDKEVDQQSANSLFFLAKSDGSATGGFQDSITFIAQEGGQYLPDGGTHSGLVQISYRLAKDPENKFNDGDFLLIRDEIPYFAMPNSNDTKDWEKAKKKAFDQRMVFPVTDNVVSFHLSYFDFEGDKWLNEWDTGKRGTVPALIRFSVTLRSPLGNTEDYSTIVPIGAGIKRR